MKTFVELSGTISVLASMWFAANKSLLAPWLGILGCFILLGVFAFHEQWGLLPLEIIAVALYSRQAFKWQKDARSCPS